MSGRTYNMMCVSILTFKKLIASQRGTGWFDSENFEVDIDHGMSASRSVVIVLAVHRSWMTKYFRNVPLIPFSGTSISFLGDIVICELTYVVQNGTVSETRGFGNH